MITRFRWIGLAALVAAGGLGGCAVNPPLLFGDSVNFGLQIASDAGGTGNGGSIGYRQRSVAVVPVSVLGGDGESYRIRGNGARGGKKDALSVFASFEAFVDPARDTDEVDLGQVFATGTAAQVVAEGLSCKMLKSPGCERQAGLQALASAAEADAAAERAHRAATSAEEAAAAVAAGVASAPVQPQAMAVAPRAEAAKPSERPYQTPLFFGRTDTLGIGLGQSSSEQGVQFDLGFSSRNVAIVPTYTMDGHGRPTSLTSEQSTPDDPTLAREDALSVFGQFKANPKTKRLGLKLERFFATGVAAQHLAEGLSGSLVATQESTRPAGPDAGGGTAAAPSDRLARSAPGESR